MRTNFNIYSWPDSVLSTFSSTLYLDIRDTLAQGYYHLCFTDEHRKVQRAGSKSQGSITIYFLFALCIQMFPFINYPGPLPPPRLSALKALNTPSFYHLT